MESKEEFIRYFKNELSGIRREIEKIYLEDNKQEKDKYYLLNIVDKIEKRIMADLKEDTFNNNDSIKDYIYYNLYLLNEVVLNLIVASTEMNQIEIPFLKGKIQFQNRINILGALNNEIDKYLSSGFIKTEFLKNVSVILDKEIDLLDYPVAYFKENLHCLNEYNCKSILKYKEFMNIF